MLVDKAEEGSDEICVVKAVDKIPKKAVDISNARSYSREVNQEHSYRPPWQIESDVVVPESTPRKVPSKKTRTKKVQEDRPAWISEKPTWENDMEEDRFATPRLEKEVDTPEEVHVSKVDNTRAETPKMNASIQIKKENAVRYVC